WITDGSDFHQKLIWALEFARFSTSSIDFSNGEIRVDRAQPFEETLYLANGSVLRNANGAIIQSQGGQLNLNSRHQIGQPVSGFNMISPLSRGGQVAGVQVNVCSLENADIADLDSIQVAGQSHVGELRLVSLTG